jgi:ribosomal protein S18 acetylase RimI-like enzyme
MAGSPRPSPEIAIVDLPMEEREDALSVIREGFEGIYRWHAKRTLKRIPLVRAARHGDEIWGVAMLERLLAEVGYVFYIAVGTAHRKTGVGAQLLDDALRIFRSSGIEVVFAAAEEDNAPSLRLFRSRGFRPVGRDAPTWKEGGLGAWGLYSRMRIVPGEVLLGLRLAPRGLAPPAAVQPTP